MCIAQQYCEKTCRLFHVVDSGYGLRRISTSGGRKPEDWVWSVGGVCCLRLPRCVYSGERGAVLRRRERLRRISTSGRHIPEDGRERAAAPAVSVRPRAGLGVLGGVCQIREAGVLEPGRASAHRAPPIWCRQYIHCVHCADSVWEQKRAENYNK